MGTGQRIDAPSVYTDNRNGLSPLQVHLVCPPYMRLHILKRAIAAHSHVFAYTSNALFLSYKQKGRVAEVLKQLPNDMSICVVTDGSRILGLGDLGVDGVGIPMGKLALYSACAGINPANTLPVVIDVGTNNADKLNDPLYLGLKQNRITPAEEKEFIAEFMQATQKRWPGMVVQFEDVRQDTNSNSYMELTCLGSRSSPRS